MSWYDPLLNPAVLPYVVEAPLFLWYGMRELRRWVNKKTGRVYSCRMCTKEGEFYKQQKELWVLATRRTFNYQGNTYTIDNKKIAFKDPAPVLVYEIGNTLAVEAKDLKGALKPEHIDAKAVDMIVEEKAVEQTLNAAKGHGNYDRLIPIICFIGGAIMTYILLYASHALKT